MTDHATPSGSLVLCFFVFGFQESLHCHLAPAEWATRNTRLREFETQVDIPRPTHSFQHTTSPPAQLRPQQEEADEEEGAAEPAAEQLSLENARLASSCEAFCCVNCPHLGRYIATYDTNYNYECFPTYMHTPAA